MEMLMDQQKSISGNHSPGKLMPRGETNKPLLLLPALLLKSSVILLALLGNQHVTCTLECSSKESNVLLSF